MRADQMHEISRGHERIVECVQSVFPEAGNVYCADSLVTYDKLATFLQDRKLAAIIEQETAGLSANDQILYRKIIWRTHTLIWAARHALGLAGDFAEFGVFHGYSVAVVARYVDFANAADRRWWLYDTFDGMPPDQTNSAPPNVYLSQAYREPALYDFVVDRFRDIPNIRVVRGRIPDILDEDGPERLAFLHIDMNSAKAERDGLAAVFERIVPGGIVIFDDYGRIAYRENHELIREFLDQQGYLVLELPTGQGMVFKR